ncbi:amphi-Trp domain-containing protein [Desulfonatronum thiosulfatophilum]|uniref:Amphi-Trp domain-containing protein n=1 Tax=Desulfonatronum thiosulfatophilum TaxID=617002 RepID=A0A1G6BPR3_9BACT|nr:amphi-Trp domain-containing protein [Desulfonatronum thiosulfatophilum]SDB22589.1 amphi-Trp domain-containing protein [Desulfonatronum thiosulfatophilum]
MSKDEVKFEGVMEKSQLVNYLEDLIASLKKGQICVRQDDQFVTLCPTRTIEVEVKASSKKDKEKFELEFKWHREEGQEDNPKSNRSSTDEDQSKSGKDPLPAVSAPAIEGQAGTSDTQSDEETGISGVGMASDKKQGSAQA